MEIIDSIIGLCNNRNRKYAEPRNCEISKEEGDIQMSGEFGQYVNAKRKGRGPGGDDILLRDLAKAMGGISVSYLSDILKGRRNPPEIGQLELMAQALSLTPEERDEMLDLAGRERAEAAPDLPGYIMDEKIPHVRTALRRASKKGLGDDFWKRIVDKIDQEE